MIPAGVFNQGASGAGMYYINFNGSYVESQHPSDPTWGDEEREMRFVTDSGDYAEILSAPTITLWGAITVTPDISVAADPIFFQNMPNTNNTNRISRTLNVGFESVFLDINIPAGAKFKIHAFCNSFTTTGSFQLITQSISPNTVLSTISTNDTRAKTFTLSPYDGGTGWESSPEMIVPNNSGIRLVLTYGFAGRTGTFNAVAIEIIND